MLEEFTPYHIICRAIEGRDIFINKEDTLRFIFQKYTANIGRPVSNLHRRDIEKAAIAILNGEDMPSNFIVIEHKPLVDCLSFSLVVNHTHDILVSNIKHGISKYMQKLHNSFAKFFNIKYNRKSTLFARPFRAVPVKTEAQLYAVTKYVNIKNPLDVFQPNWVKDGLRNREEAVAFLYNYKFSSLPDLASQRSSKILAPKTVLEQYLIKDIVGFDCQKFINDYLEEKLAIFKPFFLE